MIRTISSKVITTIIIITMLATSIASIDLDAKSRRPAKVKSVKVVSRTTSSVTLKWKKAKRAKKYQIRYKKIGAKKYKKAITKKRYIKIRNLKSNAKYVFKVRGKNKKYGKFSKKIVVKTKERNQKSKKPKGLVTKPKAFSAEKCLEYLNTKRINSGINPVKLNDVLCIAAEKKAEKVYQENRKHESGGINFVSDFLRPYPLTVCGEVIAYPGTVEENVEILGIKDVDISKETIDSWMNSKGHREILFRKGQFLLVGFGEYNGVVVGLTGVELVKQ